MQIPIATGPNRDGRFLDREIRSRGRVTVAGDRKVALHLHLHLHRTCM